MIEPYQALGLVPTMRGIRRRHEIKTNLEHLSHLIKAASWLSSLDLPVRLIAIPEGALQGFNDEVLDLDHEEFARECAIDIPGSPSGPGGGLPRGPTAVPAERAASIACARRRPITMVRCGRGLAALAGRRRSRDRRVAGNVRAIRTSSLAAGQR